MGAGLRLRAGPPGGQWCCLPVAALGWGLADLIRLHNLAAQAGLTRGSELQVTAVHPPPPSPPQFGGDTGFFEKACCGVKSLIFSSDFWGSVK